MFKIPKVNVIESDTGFSVEVLGLTGIEYKENKNKIFIDSEFLDGPSGLVIYTKSIKKWDNGQIVNNDEINRIIANVKNAFKFRNIEIQIID